MLIASFSLTTDERAQESGRIDELACNEDSRPGAHSIPSVELPAIVRAPYPRPRAPTLRQRGAIFDSAGHAVDFRIDDGPLSLETVLSGTGHYQVEARRYTLLPGQVLVVPSGCGCSAQADASSRLLSIYLPDHLVRSGDWRGTADRSRAPSQAWQTPRQLGVAPHLRADEDQLAGTLRALASPEHDSCFARELLAVAVSIGRRYVSEAESASERLSASRVRVRRELFRRLWIARSRIERDPQGAASLRALATAAALSPFHLLRNFALAFGETPARMRRRLLIEHACKLLTVSDCAIAEVAAASGFRSHAGFCRAFRRAMGVDPSRYRERRAAQSALACAA